jgi:polar amino acid transport system substrate-binding protein
MPRKLFHLFALLLIVAVLAACVAPVAPAAEAPAAEAPAAEAPAAEAPAAEAPAEAPAEGAMPDLGGRVIQAAMANDYTPFQFVDPKTGDAVGWEYDAMAAICALINCEVNFNNTSWDAMIPAVQDGQFDIGMDGITITAERAEQVDFSVPYITSQQFMLVRADEDRFTTGAEFAADPNLLIGSQAGTSGFYTAVYDILDGDEANPRIILLENFGAGVQALIAGDVDMVLVDGVAGAGYIGANPDALKIVGDPIKSEDFGFIFTPGSDLVAPFNVAIETLRADGTFEALDNKWFFEYDPNAE